MSQYNQYNVSVDGKSPLFNYMPYRAAGAAGASTAWTLSNSNPNTSYITNPEAAANVQVQLQWVGTAITLYGTTNTSSGFEVIRSWSNTVLTGNSTNGEEGVLFQEDDLDYGTHILSLTISEGPMTVIGASLITGMGPLGSILTSQNQSAVAGSESGQVNPFFQTNPNSSWVPWILEGAQAVLRTDALGDSIVFAVRTSVGFAIYGSTALSYGAYNVSIDPAPAGVPATAQYNASTAFEVLGALKYLATGLDDEQTYTVVVTNAQANKTCDIGQVVLHSAVSAPTTSTSASPTGPSNTAPVGSGSSTMLKGHRLSVGDYAGIAVSAACVLLIVVFTAWLCIRRCARRANEYPPEKVSPTRMFRGRQYRRTARDSEGSIVIDDDFMGPQPVLQVDPYIKDYAPFYIFPSSTPSQQASSSSATSPTENTRMTSPSPGPSRPLPPIPPMPAVPADEAPRSTPPSYNPAWRWTSKSRRSTKRASAQQPPHRMILQGEPVP